MGQGNQRACVLQTVFTVTLTNKVCVSKIRLKVLRLTNSQLLEKWFSDMEAVSFISCFFRSLIRV